MTNIENSLFTTAFKIRNAKNFKDNITDNTNYLYLFAGRQLPWVPDDDVPDPVYDIIKTTEYDTWKHMIYCKQISDGNIVFCIPRYNWTSGTIYSEYDDTVELLYEKEFYVLTDDNGTYSIFKCISNNNNIESTEQPMKPANDDDLNNLIYTNDGYIWRYMYTLSTVEVSTFLTESFIPVKTLTGDDGSSQYIVQSNAIDGGIDVIKLETPGDGYKTHFGTALSTSNSTFLYLDTSARNTTNPDNVLPFETEPTTFNNSVVYLESGTGAGQLRNISSYTATSCSAHIIVSTEFNPAPDNTTKYCIGPKITVDTRARESTGSDLTAFAYVKRENYISGNPLESVIVLTPGSKYRSTQDFLGNSYITIEDQFNTVDATARLIIPPYGGHGKDPQKELYGFNLLVKGSLSGNENNLTVVNDYRQFGLLENPKWANGVIYTETYADQTIVLNYDTFIGYGGATNFSIDTQIKDQSTNATGYIVDANNVLSSGSIRINCIDGSFGTNHIITTLDNNPLTANVASIVTPTNTIAPYTGNILTLSNREAIQRDETQIEEFHLIFTL